MRSIEGKSRVLAVVEHEHEHEHEHGSRLVNDPRYEGVSKRQGSFTWSR